MKTYKKALLGRKVEPDIALDVLLYSYCTTFNVDPNIAQHVPMKTIKKYMTVHGAVKEIESEEIQKATRRG